MLEIFTDRYVDISIDIETVKLGLCHSDEFLLNDET